MTQLQTILLSFLLILNLTVCGQQIVYYKLYAGVAFMPAGGFYKETYEKSGKNISHFSETLFYKKPKKVIKRKLSVDQKLNNVIKDFDSLSNLKGFTFTFDKNAIEKIKNDTFEKTYHHLTDIDIDSFFIDNKITLSLSEIKVDSMDEYTVYDGRPFTFYLKYIKSDNDTVPYRYSANMDDRINTKNIKDWLPLYILISKHHLFTTNKYVTNFFDEKHFYSVLYRFIAWRRQ